MNVKSINIEIILDDEYIRIDDALHYSNDLVDFLSEKFYAEVSDNDAFYIRHVSNDISFIKELYNKISKSKKRLINTITFMDDNRFFIFNSNINLDQSDLEIYGDNKYVYSSLTLVKEKE